MAHPLIQKCWSIISNKYFIVTAFFLSWIFFLAENNLISQYQDKQDLNEMKAKLQYLNTEIEAMKLQQQKILTDTQFLEQYAREHYHMKKANETVFVFDTIKVLGK
jgi:cell division protein DivIC